MPKQLVPVPKQRKASFKTSGIQCVLPYGMNYALVLTVPQQITLREAQTLVLRVLKQVMEEKLDQHNVQLAQVRSSVVT